VVAPWLRRSVRLSAWWNPVPPAVRADARHRRAVGDRRLRVAAVPQPSPATVPLRRLSADRLSDAIRAAVENPAYRARAQEVARRVDAEDGATRVIEAAPRILPEPRAVA
jgi:sterol 3beta-glucosyltransferase